MQPDTTSEALAPWASRVPDAPYPMGADDLLSMPDDAWQYEIVEGRLVRMPGSGGEASWIAVNLIAALATYVRIHRLGRVTGADGTYDLTRPGDPSDTVLVPDAAFVQASRLPAMGTSAAKKALRLAPDLIAEVVSPSQFHREMNKKAKLYLDCGVRLVWVIWPDTQAVDVWRPASLAAPVATLSVNDALDGFDVVPGFTMPVAELFN